MCVHPDLLIPGRLCHAADFSRPAHARYMRQLNLPPVPLHRKHWEYSLVCEAVDAAGILEGTDHEPQGLCFGCGVEHLPSYFASRGCHITATDRPDGGWHKPDLSKLNKYGLCHPDDFRRMVTYLPVDMNLIPTNLTGFDFCWSCCSLDHCGSIRLSKRFVYESLRTLRPGGIAVHTGEFALDAVCRSPDYQDTVCWVRYDVDEVLAYVRERGYRARWTEPVWGPKDSLDPATKANRLQTRVAGFRSTSFGLVIQATISSPTCRTED